MEAIKIQGLKDQITEIGHSCDFKRKVKKALLLLLLGLIIIAGSIHFYKSKNNSKSNTESIIPKAVPKYNSTFDEKEHINKEIATKSDQTIIDPLGSLKTPPVAKLQPIYEIKFQDTSSIKSQTEGLSFKQLDSVLEIYVRDVKRDTIIIGNKRKWQTTYKKQTELISYLKSNYQTLYTSIIDDFNLDDPTFHITFKVNYCNLKKTPFITASNSEKTEQYEIDMKGKGLRSREIKKFFKLCAADCEGSVAFQ